MNNLPKAEVSITAKPFFQHWGFTVVKEQEVERRGIKFKNYVMEKYLQQIPLL
ncbi:MAG: hypothetical protein ACKPJH_04260 [Dolichospermum sp.]